MENINRSEAQRKLFNEENFCEAAALQGKNSIVPREAGIYAHWYRALPHTRIDASAMHKVGEWHLGYIGITLSKNGLRGRLNQHFRGNAEGSTVRYSLGSLMRRQLLLKGSKGKTKSWGAWETDLTTWMAGNMRFSFFPCANPKDLEVWFLKEFYLPINHKGNDECHFWPVLDITRQIARENSRRI